MKKEIGRVSLFLGQMERLANCILARFLPP